MLETRILPETTGSKSVNNSDFSIFCSQKDVINLSKHGVLHQKNTGATACTQMETISKC